VNSVASVFLIVAGTLTFIALSAFGVISFREGERRATRVAFFLAAALSAPIVIAAILPGSVPLAGATAVLIVVFVLAVAWFVPLGETPSLGGRPSRRIDERDIMFARGRLIPGSREYESYYTMRPGNKSGDDHTRSLPGLLSPEARLAEPLAFAVAEASFDVTEMVRTHVDGDVAPDRVERKPESWTSAIKELARSLGAIDVGVAELRPYHVYTHVGRGTGSFGEPIELDHRWAFAFSVEMDHQRVAHAPAAPVVEESARQYVESAKIALVVANWIRRLGYPARAHIDGNYRVIAPLVARDAGLGEIGRIGLLMSPRLGPRLRLGVVTTDMPLVADGPGDDVSVIDFCTFCRKCAMNCPVGVIGTDCATCMRVCPYSHPDSRAHNLVRKAIRQSATARRVMLWLDNLFYGEKVPTVDTMDT
jgi:ferredoxin